MEKAEIARLLRPFGETGDQGLESISIYIDLLLKWTRKINLTAVRDPKEIVTRHFGESLFAATHLLPPNWRGAVIDVGSGAGFPGLPMAMSCSTASVTLIESQGKKAAFLKEVIYALALKNVSVFNGRAEGFPSQGDLVTLRAVEQFEKVLPISIKLVKRGGSLGLMIGKSQIEAARQLLSTVEWKQPLEVPGGHSRALLIGINS
ncbi:MAG TPA: 16S rRNA (guanine(527)-N(7))-methyltransferase RsmG [Candidatus Angelobacter sp.]|nr:16S rRNA (guanine(527)-N(7))-methyltransferase RsmG [Candidatus Angelobacter sp.]